MNDEMTDEINRLRGLSIIHAAEIEALFKLLTTLHEKLHLTDNDKENIYETYIRLRKEAGEELLIRLEDHDPELAARTQAMLDDSCKNFPI